MSHLMEKKWLEMVEAFLKLTPEQRAAEAEKRLDETLERKSQMYNISPEEAYEKLIKNSCRSERRRYRKDDQDSIWEALKISGEQLNDS